MLKTSYSPFNSYFLSVLHLIQNAFLSALPRTGKLSALSPLLKSSNLRICQTVGFVEKMFPLHALDIYCQNSYQ